MPLRADTAPPLKTVIRPSAWIAALIFSSLTAKQEQTILPAVSSLSVQARVLCDPFAIPDYFPQCYALDVGWNRTAALWAALDPNTDIAYLYSEHYRGEAEPPIHAAAIRARGIWIPGVIDPAARGRGQKDGSRLMKDYQDLGLDTLTAAENALEAGIYEVWTRMTTGRLKAFRTLSNWVAEFRFYQRDEKGKVKDGQADHLMDDTRYIVLSGLERAIVRPPNLWTTGKTQSQHTANYDPL